MDIMKTLTYSNDERIATEKTIFSHFINITSFAVDKQMIDSLIPSYESDDIFRIGGRKVRFTLEDVAIIIGLACEDDHIIVKGNLNEVVSVAKMIIEDSGVIDHNTLGAKL